MTLQIESLEKRLITVLEYHKMAEVGILTEEDKVELLNGEIINMSPINSKHSSHISRFTEILYDVIRKRAVLRTENPIAIPDFSEPEPDIVIAKLDKDYYAARHPQPGDIHILMEVSDSTLLKDREVKLPIYATANIKEYWIVNLVDTCIEVYKNPKKDTYTSKSTFYKGDEIELEDFKVKIKVSDILK